MNWQNETDQMTLDEAFEHELGCAALNGRDADQVADPEVLAWAVARLAGAASGIALCLADRDAAAAPATTPDDRDRWDLYGTLLLWISDVLDGDPDEAKRATVARATEHLETDGQFFEGLFPDSEAARNYRRERGLED